MGTITKTARISGKNLESAFRDLQRSDEEEYGNDCYSGGWNNATGIRLVSASEFDKRLKNEVISKHEDAIAKCVRKPVGNTNKIKTTVTNFPCRGTRKWVTVYAGEDQRGNVVVSDISQTKAIKKARAYVEKNPKKRVNIYITKELQTDSKVAEINYKPSSKEADGVWKIFGGMSY